jgi:starch phosphorylase
MKRFSNFPKVPNFQDEVAEKAYAPLELLAEEPDAASLIRDIEDVKKRCVFTTHTPVAAGHDQFSYDLVLEVLSAGSPRGDPDAGRVR